MNAEIASSVQLQADRWFARRQTPGFGGEERAEFERWLAAHPRHRQAYAATEALWGELGDLRQDDEIAALARAAARPAPSGRRRPLLMAASIAVVAVAGGLLLKPVLFPSPPPVVHATAVGEQRTLTLEDGSVLILNTDTEIVAGFTRRQRDVTLNRGEAQFEVRPDPRRPFVVASGEGSVTALGTRFQVRRTGEAVTVTLIEGSVAVAQDRHAGQRRVLQPGEQAEYGAGVAGIAHRRVDVEAATGWTEGRLRFRDTPLPDAVAEVNRYAARRLVVDPALAGITVSGTFGTDEPDAFVAALEAMFPIRAEPQDDSAHIRLVRSTSR